MPRNNRIILLSACVLTLAIIAAGCGTKVFPKLSQSYTPPAAEAPESVQEAAPPPETLEELVLRYADEYAALTESQRSGLTRAWQENDFRYGYPVEMLRAYSSYVSMDAAIVLYYWNARYCIDYVRENYTGGEELFTQLESVLNDNTEQLLPLWSGDMTRNEFVSALVDNLSALYTELNNVISAGKVADAAQILGLLSEYGPSRGAEDAEAFFRMVDEAQSLSSAEG